MMIQLLADATGAATSQMASGISPEAVGAIIGSVIIALIGGGFLGKKVSDSTKVHVGPQPFEVRMEKEFYSRRDGERLETLVTINAARSESLFQQAMEVMVARDEAASKRMERNNLRVNKELQAVASNAYQARGKIHLNVNAQGERLAKVEAHADVAKAIEKLAEAINPQTKIQPTHPSNA